MSKKNLNPNLDSDPAPITAVKILFLMDSELELKNVKKDLNSESGSGSSTGNITALV